MFSHKHSIILGDLGIYSGFHSRKACKGLSIRFEVDGDIESSWLWGLEAPTQARSLGATDAPSGVQGQSPVEGPRKQNELNISTLPKIACPQRNFNKSHFLKRTVLLMINQLFYLFIPNKF